MPVTRAIWPFLVAVLLATPCARGQTTEPGDMAGTPGFHKLRFQTQIDGRDVNMAYLTFLPKAYAQKPNAVFPMMVFLHGGGERGEDLTAMFVHGPAAVLAQDKRMRETFPGILLCPQCPPRGQRWDQPAMYKSVVELIRKVSGELRVDKDRVSVTGLSMGGKGTWLVSMEAPELFAAAAPMAADTVPAESGEKFANMAVWAVAGANDGDPGVPQNSRRMVDLIKAAGGDAHLTVLPTDHNCWSPVYACPQFYEWMFDQRRTAAAAGDPAPQAPGLHLVYFQSGDDDQAVQMPYTLYLPQARSPRPRPMILYLHEYGAIGTEGGGLYLHGVQAELEKKSAQKLKATFPFVVIAPMCPLNPRYGWDQPHVLKALMALVDDAVGKYHVDKNRVYVTGINQGGAAAWMLALANPTRFAAIAPIIGDFSYAPPDDAPDTLGKLGVWAFYPSVEQPPRTRDVVARMSGDARSTALDAAADVTEKYRDELFYDWLLRHHAD